jgi:hypothetical protein
VRDAAGEVIFSVGLYVGSNIRDESKGSNVPFGKGLVGSSRHSVVAGDSSTSGVVRVIAVM